MRKKYIEVSRCFCTPYPSPMEADDRLLRSWRTRLALEGYDGRFWFITLSYDDTHLPSDALPHREDITNFIKRFRSYGNYHKIDLSEFRIFLASDFGGDYGRPHYHALFFGLPYGIPLKSMVAHAWKNGFIKIKIGNIQRINYVTKYLTKRHNPDIYFTFKSNGIGNRFLQRPGLIDRIRERNSTTVTWNGTEYRLPRFMLNQVYPDPDEKRNVLAIESENIDNRYYVKFLNKFGKDCQYLIFDGLQYNLVDVTPKNISYYERQRIFDKYQQRRNAERTSDVDLWRLRGIAIQKARS